jgi:hypothetical protein
MTALPIDSFDGEFRFLSNFYWHPMYVPYLHKGEGLNKLGLLEMRWRKRLITLGEAA